MGKINDILGYIQDITDHLYEADSSMDAFTDAGIEDLDLEELSKVIASFDDMLTIADTMMFSAESIRDEMEFKLSELEDGEDDS